MLPLKPRDQLTPGDVRQICARFNEGMRVEYKGSLDRNVRDKLPKIVSSFANSYGGIVIVGVKTSEGRPLSPIEGFEKPEGEELPLTIENICHQNIYPVLTPLVTEIGSDVPGKVFLLIEIEPSPEAPHAIENSRQVYIRTGSASEPYDLADLDLIERLIKRRENVLAQRLKFENEASVLVQKILGISDLPKVRVIVGPRYPHVQIADRERIYRFLRDTPFKNLSRFYSPDSLRRVPDGACGTRGNREFGYLDTFGHVCHFELVTCQQGPEGSYYVASELVHPLLHGLSCSSRLYEAVGFRGEISISVLLGDSTRRTCIYASHRLQPTVEVIPAESFTSSERFREDMLDLATDLFHQLIWPMTVEDESITAQQIRPLVEDVLPDYLA